MLKPIVAAVAALFMIQPALAAPTLNDFTIYADETVDLGGGGPYGHIGYGVEYYNNANAQVSSVTKVTGPQRAALTSQAETLSQTLSTQGKDSYNITGQTKNAVLHSNGVGDLIITLSASDALTYATHFTFDAPGATSVILNVPGATPLLFEFVSSLDASKILFNFFEATTVGGTGNSKGTILAPQAFVDLAGITLDGSIVSNKFHGANDIITGNGWNFVGPGVPEPATWAMLILGFAVVGAAMRRRAAKPALAA